MKAKQFLFFAVAALALASCSSENDVVQTPNVVEQTAADNAVVFDAYQSRGTTRAGLPGTLTTNGTSTNFVNQSLRQTGFGVFAYYCDGEPYSENAKPDFMYNQKVSGSDWSYTPVKYWPNEFGSSAESEGTDRLTFFAYAPWVDVDLYSGLAKATQSGEQTTTGIVAMTRNTTHGDPFVKYYADFNPENRVDLCWAVAKNDFTSSVLGNDNKIDRGNPYIDVMKPKIGDKINFEFKHALAALNVTIDADVDLAGHGDNAYLDNFTKIWVRSVTFEGFTDKGMLNLNSKALSANYTPEWYDLSGNNKIGSGGKTTIYDGLRDGSEPLGDASNETPAALNPRIIQSLSYDANPYDIQLATTPTDLSGVPSNEIINLFNSTTASEPIYVIPTNDIFKVTIVYDVETADKNLTNYLSDGVVRGSSVENKISKTITINNNSFRLQAGKLYNIALHLGMTSVKFDASVSEWEENTADPTWLPVNGGVFAAGVTTHTLSVPYRDVINKKFAVTGLKGSGVSVSPTGVSPQTASLNAITGTPSASSIVSESSTITFSMSDNATVYNRADKITITETGGGNTVTEVTVTQNAAPLVLTNSGIDGTGKIITLASTGEVAYTDASTNDWKTAANWEVVKTAYDGSKTTLSKVDNSETDNQYSVTGISSTAATINLGTAAAVGDVYTISCKVGDAEKETTVVRIGGLMFISPITAVAKDATVTNTAVLIGTGTITYSDGSSANHTADGAKVTGKNSGTAGTEAANKTTITATLSPGTGDGYSYPTASRTATYDIYLADYAVGGIHDIPNNASSAITLYVCGLAPSSTKNYTESVDYDWLTIDTSSSAAPNENGIAKLVFTPTANSTTGAPERMGTIILNGREFYIRQAAGPNP